MPCVKAGSSPGEEEKAGAEKEEGGGGVLPCPPETASCSSTRKAREPIAVVPDRCFRHHCEVCLTDGRRTCRVFTVCGSQRQGPCGPKRPDWPRARHRGKQPGRSIEGVPPGNSTEIRVNFAKRASKSASMECSPRQLARGPGRSRPASCLACCMILSFVSLFASPGGGHPATAPPSQLQKKLISSRSAQCITC